MLGKDKLVFDATAANDADNVGAYLRSADGTLLTHTTVGGKEALDVNVANEVDIRDLNSATDSVTAIQGTSPWVVSATDLDIRDLSHTQDNIAIAQGGNTMVVNADGSINVNADIDVVNGAEKAEDAAHASGDVGQFVLAVRQDVLAPSTSTDGDYAAFKVNAQGALYVEVVNQTTSAIPAFSSLLVSQNNIGITAELVVPSDLTNRKRILVQNVSSNRTVYLGHDNTVSTTTGIRLSAGGSIEIDLGAGVALYAISNTASADLRIAELAD